jgi:hypothetical protein
MTATSSPNRRVSVYQNGQPYKPAVGRFAPQARVEDHLAVGPPVVQGGLLRDSSFAVLSMK